MKYNISNCTNVRIVVVTRGGRIGRGRWGRRGTGRSISRIQRSESRLIEGVQSERDRSPLRPRGVDVESGWAEEAIRHSSEQPLTIKLEPEIDATPMLEDGELESEAESTNDATEMPTPDDCMQIAVGPGHNATPALTTSDVCRHEVARLPGSVDPYESAAPAELLRPNYLPGVQTAQSDAVPLFDETKMKIKSDAAIPLMQPHCLYMIMRGRGVRHVARVFQFIRQKFQLRAFHKKTSTRMFIIFFKNAQEARDMFISVRNNAMSWGASVEHPLLANSFFGQNIEEAEAASHGHPVLLVLNLVSTVEEADLLGAYSPFGGELLSFNAWSGSAAVKFPSIRNSAEAGVSVVAIGGGAISVEWASKAPLDPPLSYSAGDMFRSIV